MPLEFDKRVNISSDIGSLKNQTRAEGLKEVLPRDARLSARIVVPAYGVYPEFSYGGSGAPTDYGADLKERKKHWGSTVVETESRKRKRSYEDSQDKK